MHQLISCYMLGFDSRRVLNGNHLPWMWYTMKIFPLQSHSTPPPVCNREILPAVVNLWQKRRILCWSLLYGYLSLGAVGEHPGSSDHFLPQFFSCHLVANEVLCPLMNDAYNRIWTSLLLTTDEFYSSLGFQSELYPYPMTVAVYIFSEFQGVETFCQILQILDQKSNSAANLIDQLNCDPHW